MADSTVIITGNLTDQPELRFTSNGTPVASFTVAITERRQEGGTWKDGETSYSKCNAWRQLAEHASESLSKGDRCRTYLVRQRRVDGQHDLRPSSSDVSSPVLPRGGGPDGEQGRSGLVVLAGMTISLIVIVSRAQG